MPDGKWSTWFSAENSINASCFAVDDEGRLDIVEGTEWTSSGLVGKGG